MKKQLMVGALAAALGLTLVTSGCSVMRGQESTSEYVDDASITANVKARLVDSKAVDAGAVSVETLKGEVSLSGFAKSPAEKARAGQIAGSVKGVRAVHNNLVIRPAR